MPAPSENSRAWEIFEQAAPTYEAWYSTPAGRRVDRAERALLAWLLQGSDPSGIVLDIGCGTGHFARWLAQRREAVGLDRSAAMLSDLRRRAPGMLLVRGDAQQLPFRPRTVDVALFVTTLEFLPDASAALREAVRVAHRRVVAVVLNRRSLGGLSRRYGRQAGRPLLGQARDCSVTPLRKMFVAAAGARLLDLRWTGALFPGLPWSWRAPLPFGDVIGMAATLA